MRPVEPNRRPPLATVVADKIRDAIVSGEIGLGEALSEDRLAASLGVSRTPVREALTTLQLQGLISIQPQRGSFVFQPTEEDVAELCEFRLMSEARAMWLAFARDREAALRQMREAQEAMEAAVEVRDDAATARADAAFHDAFFANCGNRHLVQAYSLISGRISAIRVLLLHPTAIRSRSLDDHREIIEAFGLSNLVRAEAVLGSHVMKMQQGYRETAQARQTRERPPQRHSA